MLYLLVTALSVSHAITIEFIRVNDKFIILAGVGQN